MTFSRIATHLQPHLDEMVGIYLLVKFGEFMFPGISNAMVEFWDTMPEGKPSKQLEEEGVLLVGKGGGRFDEHPSAQNGRKVDKSAATLIAEELGLEEDLALKPLLDFARRRDLKLTGTSFDLHALVKTLYNTHRDDETVWKWAYTAIEAIYDQNLNFFDSAAPDFRRAKIQDVRIAGGRTIKLVTGVSDSREFAKFARSPHGCRAGIVIQQNSAGNVQVQTNNRLNINLVDAVRMIRIEEIKASGKVVPQDWKYLETDGTLPVCEEWHFFPEGKMLLNGSTTTGKPPSRLKLNRIEQLVQIGVDPRAFEPARATQCEQGRCTSRPQNPCPWYGWGLQRCRKIRFDAASNNQSRNTAVVSR